MKLIYRNIDFSIAKFAFRHTQKHTHMHEQSLVHQHLLHSHQFYQCIHCEYFAHTNEYQMRPICNFLLHNWVQLLAMLVHTHTKMGRTFHSFIHFTIFISTQHTMQQQLHSNGWGFIHTIKVVHYRREIDVEYEYGGILWYGKSQWQYWGKKLKIN